MESQPPQGHDRAARRSSRNLIADLDAVVWEADAATGTFTYVSDGIERILGLAPTAWKRGREGWLASVHPEDRDLVDDARARAAATGLAFDLTYRLMGADGDPVRVRDLGTSFPPTRPSAAAAGDHRLRRRRRLRGRAPRYRGAVPHADRAGPRDRVLGGRRERPAPPRLREPPRAGAARHHARGMDRRLRGVVPDDPPRRPRAGPPRERADRGDRRAVLDRVPDDRARRARRVVPRRGRARLRRRRRHPALLAGRDDRHHRPQGGGDPARRGRGPVPRARGADAHDHLHRRRSKARPARSTSARRRRRSSGTRPRTGTTIRTCGARSSIRRTENAPRTRIPVWPTPSTGSSRATGAWCGCTTRRA